MWLKWHILTSKWRPLFGIVYKLIVPCEHSGTVIKAVFDEIVCFSSAWGFRPSVYNTIWELVKHHSTVASLSWQMQGLCTYPNNTRYMVNTLRPRQNGRQNPDDIFKGNFLNKNVWFPIKISLEFVPKGLINNISSLVQVMTWRR